MTKLEEKLLAENERLRKELEDLKRKRFEMEVLDETHVKFNGQVFHRTKKGHFYRAVSLHEAVWRIYFGDIPAGYIIHHRNKNKADNRIENLQLMTEAEHRAWHNQHDKISYKCGREFQILGRGEQVRLLRREDNKIRHESRRPKTFLRCELLEPLHSR